ncbi:thrombomodulin [Tachyglossus aculeatus]|uniref:thrombomodulin n=1 Tax=Tachyglossus aculeatus TaxID=9261 RepID=UPI0018F3A05F|nr:thrombomodulin [Tachyglossus aculeatus]
MLPLWPLWLLAPARALPQRPAASDQAPAGSQCIGPDCFAVFWTAASFEGAARLCESRGGHLMTVRSSVAADVIALLLLQQGAPARTPGGRLWIGLKLDAHACGRRQDGPLRGFSWVTGDRNTSYSKWRNPDGAGCGPLCVAVPASPLSEDERDPVWDARPCDADSVGFLCEYNYPDSCQALAPAAGALYSTPFGGSGADFQSLPPDSVAFVGQLGLELTCGGQGHGEGLRWGRAGPGPWDCSLERGGCQGTCKREPGGPKCECPKGAALLDDGRSCGPQGDPCSGKCEQYCLDVPHGSDSFQCMCDSGFTLGADGRTCVDIDDCVLGPSPCPQVCINEMGGFRCECHPGYRLENGNCVPPDCASLRCEYQCLVQPDGLPRCECAPGFAPQSDRPESCVLFCNQTQCPADCDPSPGGACSCPTGYILEEKPEAEGGNVCSDVDECWSGSCDQGCRNLPGSFECSCHDGFRLDPSREGVCLPDGPDDGDGANEDAGSGEPSSTPPTSIASPTARPAVRGVSPGALVGIVLGALALAAVLVAVAWRLQRRQCAALGPKGAGPAKEVRLHQVRTEPVPQKL